MGTGRVWRLRRRLMKDRKEVTIIPDEKARSSCGRQREEEDDVLAWKCKYKFKFKYKQIQTQHKYKYKTSVRAGDCDPKHQHKQLVQLKEVAFSGKPAIAFFSMV